MKEEDKDEPHTGYYRSLIEGFDEIYKICIKQLCIICSLAVAVVILLILLMKF